MTQLLRLQRMLGSLIPNNRYVSTAQVAEAIGVSVTTVKRWVDDGIIPAHRTAGGHRKLLLNDVVRIVREGRLPNADLSKLLPDYKLEQPISVPQTYQELIRALFDIDPNLTRSIIHKAFERGLPIHTIADDIVGPAMVEIGRLWEIGKIGVMHEHRATQAVVTALYELKGRIIIPNDIQRPLAVGGAPEHDPTVIPTLMAKLVLIEQGWNAINLGPQTPLMAFHTAITELRPHLIWICATHLPDEKSFLRDLGELARRARDEDIEVIIGGRTIRSELMENIPHIRHGGSMKELADHSKAVFPTPGMPRRGRPPITHAAQVEQE